MEFNMNFAPLLAQVSTATPAPTPAAAQTTVSSAMTLGQSLVVIFFGIIGLLVIIVAIVFAYRFIRDPRPASPAERNADSTRTTLALWVVLASVIGVVLFAIISVVTADPSEQSEVSQKVMTAVLPLLGTWVGTVMAFYFGQKNFESAAQHTESAAISGGSIATKLDLEGLLKSKLVSDKMLPIEKAFVLRLAAGDRDAAYKAHKLVDMVNELDAAGAKQNTKWYRIPVLDDQMRPVFVVHRSIIDEFINQQTAKTPPANREDLTLYDLYQDPYFRSILDDSVVTLATNMTLKDAKDAMVYKKDCQDVFVTRTGGSNEAVIGWITNNDIQDAAKV